MVLAAQVREAEEARAREKARREAEAKKQAKTRVLMSSLFDKVRNSVFSSSSGTTTRSFLLLRSVLWCLSCVPVHNPLLNCRSLFRFLRKVCFAYWRQRVNDALWCGTVTRTPPPARRLLLVRATKTTATACLAASAVQPSPCSRTRATTTAGSTTLAVGPTR